MTWRNRSVFAAPFAPRTANAIAAAGLRTLGDLDGLSRDALGDRLPDLTSSQIDAIGSVIDDHRAGAAA